MLFTVMLSRARSLAMVRAKPMRAVRIVLEMSRLVFGCFTVIDIRFTTRPHLRSRMCGTAA
jgi:hypothetical protein